MRILKVTQHVVMEFSTIFFARIFLAEFFYENIAKGNFSNFKI